VRIYSRSTRRDLFLCYFSCVCRYERWESTIPKIEKLFTFHKSQTLSPQCQRMICDFKKPLRDFWYLFICFITTLPVFLTSLFLSPTFYLPTFPRKYNDLLIIVFLYDFSPLSNFIHAYPLFSPLPHRSYFVFISFPVAH